MHACMLWKTIGTIQLTTFEDVYKYIAVEHLVNFLNRWATGTTWWSTSTETTSRHATLWHAAATCSLVYLHHNWVHDTIELFLLGLKLILLRKLILVQPIKSLL